MSEQVKQPSKQSSKPIKQHMLKIEDIAQAVANFRATERTLLDLMEMFCKERGMSYTDQLLVDASPAEVAEGWCMIAGVDPDSYRQDLARIQEGSVEQEGGL